ncbi:MAG: hypothetical protein M1839_007160 [Geoglossum umbratile]|nr:MAG: hypothetical protein M1839_007160 [Geoglossum umbratile]
MLRAHYDVFCSKLLPLIQYRPNGQSRRSGARGYVDHDFYEGLPVRHWRRTTVQVGVPPKPEVPSRLLQPELPLPKEASLLTPMSRALLQAARAGTINKVPPAEEEAVVKEGEEDEEDEERGFVASRWGVVPRHLEGPEPEYLAKKRKGLELKASAGGSGNGAGGGVAKKAKIRRTDTEGNAYVEEIVIADGQRVEGQVIAEVAMTDAGVPATAVEGTGAVNSDGVVVAVEAVQPTPPRRRPPPPRRKPRGPGRGRKKKVQFVPGAEGVEGVGARGGPATTNSSLVDGQPSVEGAVPGAGLGGGFGHDDGDIEMIDDPNLRDGDEEDDDNEEGEEGDEADDDDREEGELTPSPTPDDATSSVGPDQKFHEQSTQLAHPAASVLNHPLPPRPDVQMPTADDVQRSVSSSPDLPLAADQRIDPSIKGEGEAPDSVLIDDDATTLAEVPTPAQENQMQDPVQDDPLQGDLMQGLIQADQLLGIAVQEDPPQEDQEHGDLLQEDLVQGNPIQEGLMFEDLIQDDLMREDSIPGDLVQEVLALEDPAQDDPVQEYPKLEDLVQEEPVKEAPNQESSNQGDPTQEEPKQEDLIQKDPVQEGLVHEDLIQEDLVQEDLGQEDLAQEDLVQEGLVQEDLLQEDLVQEDLVQEDLVQEDLVQEDLVQEDLVQENPIHEDPAQEDPEQEEPLQTNLAQESPALPPQIEEFASAEKEQTPPADASADTATHDIGMVEEVHFADGDIDLFGSLEKHLAEHSSVPTAAIESPPAVVENLDDIIGNDGVVGEEGSK